MEITVGSKKIVISNPEKILFPKKGKFPAITKTELVAYYQAVASYMVVHTKNRPLTLQRFPDGIGHTGFYQKDASDFFPPWIEQQPVAKETGGTVSYILGNNEATLVYIAQLACITPHMWLSRADDLNRPDRIIFDLDPAAGVTFSRIRWLALELKKTLEKAGLVPFVMLTGSRGVHVVAPLKRNHDFDAVRDYATKIGQDLVEKYPALLTMTVRKSQRGKRIFIDVLRNAWSATTVVPYAVRPHPGAPVAMPVSWERFARIASSQAFTMKTAVAHIKKYGDVWKDMQKYARRLSISKK